MNDKNFHNEGGEVKFETNILGRIHTLNVVWQCKPCVHHLGLHKLRYPFSMIRGQILRPKAFEEYFHVSKR